MLSSDVATLYLILTYKLDWTCVGWPNCEKLASIRTLKMDASHHKSIQRKYAQGNLRLLASPFTFGQGLMVLDHFFI